jgi:penicillin-binding protein 1A
MTVMDQATGYNVFAAGGLAGTRHAVTQILNHAGDVVYDWSRDAPPPHRVLSEKAVASMNSILVQIPEIGTARRAALEGIRSAGKTGTTQSYRDAWYVGFTGNYTAAVWLGNDDFTPSNDMTGGSLPAMVWQRLMTDVHRGVELRPIPGIDKPYVDPLVAAKAAEAERQRLAALPTDPDVPPSLAPETTDALRTLAERFRGAALVAEKGAPDRMSAL